MSGEAARCDLFVDLSHLAAARAVADHLDCLAQDAGLAGVVGRVTVVAPRLPPRSEAAAGFPVEGAAGEEAPLALARALGLAARARRHLVLLLGGVVPGSEVLAALAAGLEQDPLVGTTQPRFAEPASDRLWPLPGAAEREEIRPTTRRVDLPALPADLITPELPACCLLLRWELLVGIEPLRPAGRSLAGTLHGLLAQARRLGFRNLVLNRLVVPSPLPYPALYPSAPPEERAALEAEDAEVASLSRVLEELPQRRLEALLDASAPDGAGRRRLLLDCRGMPALHNGTAVCILGLLEGFAALEAPWSLEVLSTPAAAAWHGLARRFPRFRHLTQPSEEPAAAALLLNQPWDIAQVAALHRQALAMGFVMLDSIAWDIFPGRAGIEAAWHFIAQHADALFYISDFTRQRFRRRFPVGPGVDEAVTHLSLAAEDYPGAEGPAPRLAHEILVFGNAYDHKHVGPTARLLADAFPFHRIAALGLEAAPRANVTPLPSGQTSRRTLRRLVAGAGVIVFPSFYEGFGLPVVEGLAQGRPVLVRRSPLWREIADHARLPGRLSEFDDPASLVQAVSLVLEGRPPPALPMGGALVAGAGPPTWADGARTIATLLADRLAGSRRPGTGLEHWSRRDQALAILPR